MTRAAICVVHSCCCLWYDSTIKQRKRRIIDTDKIYAEQLASEYAPKDASKMAALHELDVKANGIFAALVMGVGWVRLSFAVTSLKKLKIRT